MTRMTSLGLNRRFEKSKTLPGANDRRPQKIEIPMQKMTIKCGNGVEFEILAHPGQLINQHKMCKKLLKESFNQINNGNEEKKFISKGYKGQRR